MAYKNDLEKEICMEKCIRWVEKKLYKNPTIRYNELINSIMLKLIRKHAIAASQIREFEVHIMNLVDDYYQHPSVYKQE